MTTTAETTAFALGVCPWLERHRHRADERKISVRTKRSLDLCLVAIIGVPSAILILVLFLLVKLNDADAPALHSQLRTGQDGRRFRIWKIRTMVPDAEEVKGSLLETNSRQWPDFKIADDPRVTRIGSVLRKTHLDELPQLLNVITGTMSIVGPRPTSFSVDDYEEWHRARLQGKPGLTGLWQVSAGESASFDERVMLDIEYLARRSVRLDLAILARTVPHVVRGQGDL